jgi:hypothetical protein
MSGKNVVANAALLIVYYAAGKFGLSFFGPKRIPCASRK